MYSICLALDATGSQYCNIFPIPDFYRVLLKHRDRAGNVRHHSSIPQPTSPTTENLLVTLHFMHDLAAR